MCIRRIQISQRIVGQDQFMTKSVEDAILEVRLETVEILRPWIIIRKDVL